MSKPHVPLVSTLQEIFSQPEDLMVTLLVDSSTSVAKEFDKLRNLCLKLIAKLAGVRVQIIQFSNTASRKCDFTSDTETLETTLTNMKITQERGGTDMHSALSFVLQSLSPKCVETSVPIVFMITDGENRGQDPQPVVEKLLEMNPKTQIIAVGIGTRTNLKTLEKLLVGQKVFHMDAYSNLELLIEELVLQRPTPEPLIRLTFTPTNVKPQRFKDPLHLKFQCHLGSSIQSLPKGTQITILHNAYYYSKTVQIDKRVTNQTPYTGKLTLEVRASANLEDFPEEIQFVVEVPNAEKTKYKGTVSMLLGWFASDFIVEGSNHPFNIAVFGNMGSGKSAWVNGILGLFTSDRRINRPLMSYQSGTHVTKVYARTPVSKHLDKTPTPLSEALRKRLHLTCWDSMGFTLNQNTNVNVNLKHFLEGFVRPDTEFELEREPKPENVIHGVIIIIPIGTSEASELLQTLKAHIKTVLEFGLFPVVVINFLNTVTSEADRKRSYEAIVAASGLKKADCILFDNYVEETTRSMEKDLMYWRILDQVFQQGQLKYLETGEALKKKVKKLKIPFGAGAEKKEVLTSPRQQK